MRLKVYGFAALAGALTLAGVVATAQSGVQIFRVRDDCDPATFNAGPPDGPGLGVICNPTFNGDITFTEFIQELTEDQQVGHWRFQPEEKELDRGQATAFDSTRAGEFHTFTKVADFGGGIIPLLNDLSGAGATRPECGSPDTGLLPPGLANNFLNPNEPFVQGPTAGSAALPRGTTKWQCCIHPWMRSEVKVRR